MKPKQELRDKPQRIYRIPFKCGREYFGEISRRVDVRINMNVREQDNFWQIQFAAHVLEEGHQCKWNQTVILQFEPNTLCRK
jgi:hypothetical protein